MFLLKKLKKFFIEDRYLREKIQRDLDQLLYTDKSLSEEQYELLYNVIHKGAYLSLHSTEAYKSFYKERVLYENIVEKHKNDDVHLIYELIKKACLHNN